MLHTRAPMEFFEDCEDYDGASSPVRTKPVHTGRENNRGREAVSMVRGAEVPTVQGSVQVARGRGAAILGKICATERYIEQGGISPQWHEDEEVHDPRHVHNNVSHRRQVKHHDKA